MSEAIRTEVVRSMRAGERVTRTAERVLNADRLLVSVPEHVEELAQEALNAAPGDPEAARAFAQAVDRWRSRIERLGQAGGSERPVGEYTMRSATEQLVRDLDGATEAQVARSVNRWILERATYHARIVARTETSAAYRDSYERSLERVDGVIGYRWTLSPRHPRPDVCFPAGSRVLTASGAWQAIETLRAGDSVIAHDGTTREVLATTRTAYVGEFVTAQAVLPTGEAIEATATGTHPFAVEGGWRRAADLRTGDRVRAIPCPPPHGARNRLAGGIVGRVSPCSPEALLIGTESVLVKEPIDVFNIEVEGAHTYIAEGFVVHNCDVYASQDLFGLGPGGYPADQVPATPHPSCLCSQSAILDRFALQRELAVMRGEPEPPRDWESGRRETGAEWLARQPASFRDSLLGPTRARIFATEPGRVLTPQGAPIPVHQVLGQPPPVRSAGRQVQTAPLVRAERAVRPTPPLGG